MRGDGAGDSEGVQGEMAFGTVKGQEEGREGRWHWEQCGDTREDGVRSLTTQGT